jgi:hypothetical protein
MRSGPGPTIEADARRSIISTSLAFSTPAIKSMTLAEICSSTFFDRSKERSLALPAMRKIWRVRSRTPSIWPEFRLMMAILRIVLRTFVVHSKGRVQNEIQPPSR